MSVFVVLQQITPLFIIMAIGILIARLGYSSRAVTQFLSWVCISVFFPASIIKSFSAPVTAQMLQEASVLVVAGAIVVTAAFALSFGIVRLLRMTIPSSNIVYFSLMFSNFGFVGVGILTAVYGDKGLFYMTMFVLVMRFMFNSLGTVIMQRGEGAREKPTLKDVFLNPPIIALLVAVLVMVFQIRFPAPIKNTIDSLAACLSPVGMLTVGLLTASISIRDFIGDRRVYVLAFLRLAGIPLVTTLVMWLAGFRGLMLTAPALTMALPAAANCSLMAERFDGDVSLGTRVVTLTNIFSIITMPLIVAFAERLAR